MEFTFGPSLMRTEGIPRRGTGVVFHQFGALRREIFSSTLSFATRSGILAERKGCDMLEEWEEWPPRVVGFYTRESVGKTSEPRSEVP